MPSQNVYIDTDMLIFYFDKTSDKGRIARDTINKIKNGLDNSEIHVKTPQVVLGELLLSSCEGKCELVKIIKLLKDLEAEFPSADSEILACAQELMNGDQYIQPNDAMLIAHALKDESTEWLFTTDRNLITNLEISRKMDEMKNKFSIASSFHSI